MKVLLQRVSRASVEVENEIVGSIEHGLLLFVGFGAEDSNDSIVPLRDKILNLRVFPDDDGKFDKSVKDVGGGILIVSQFTLYGECRKGRRPDFVNAMHPKEAEPLYDAFVAAFREAHEPVATGVFRAMMNVALENDGPVTLMLEHP